MKKKTLMMIGICMMLGVAFTGCANSNTTTEQSAQTEAIADTSAAEAEQTEDADTDTVEAGQTEDTDMDTVEAEETEDTDMDEDTDATYNAEEDGEDVLSAISLFHYDFSSGVGGWATSLYINEDGSFYGDFHDADAGETGDGYEGVVYLSQFTGKFTLPVRVNDFVYKMQIESITYADECDTEEIVDGMLMKYTDAYGLENAKDIYIYLIGTPLDELPEEYIRWVTGKGVDLDGLDTLPFCGIYNESQQEGFSGAWKE